MRVRNPLIQTLKQNHGFSLVEILVGLTLLALAAAFIGTQVFDRLEEGRVTSTKIQMQSLGQILEDYRRICFNYPSTDQGLEALIAKPTGGAECKAYPENGFIKGNKVPTDAWDRPFFYESDGQKYRISSLGRDGAEGGTGSAADIKSDEL